MPSTQVVQVVVEKLNKFGFYDQTGGVYYSKNLKDTDKLKVVPGAKFNAEYYVADSGSRYLNKVFDMLVTTEQVKKETVHTPKPETAKETAKSMGQIIKATESKSEAKQPAHDKESYWANREAGDAAKDLRISRSGVIQAAVQALTGVYPTVVELYDGAEELALKMLDFVNEK